jgi:hypothetical protein
MQMVPVTNDMTDKQAALVSALLQGHSIPAAGRIAGYAHDSGAYQAVSSATVQNSLRAWRQRVLNTRGRILGINTLIELCEDKETPAGVRFNAAKALAFAGVELDEDESEIGDMTEAQLEQVVRKLEAKAAAGGDPPVIRVRPDPGAAQGTASGTA